MGYILMTDTNSDITYPFVDRYDIKIIYMPYFIDGQELFSDLSRSSRNQEFYKTMRSGVTPTTALLNEAQYEEYFEPYLKDGQDILYIHFSENLSASIAHGRTVAARMNEKYPDNRVVMVDSTMISFGEAMLVVEAAKQREAGKSLDEVAEYVKENRLKFHSWFAVDDLIYLKRGGRLSSTSATFGTMLDIKPIIFISTDGKIMPVMKVKGQKKAMRTLLDKFDEEAVDKSLAAVLDADCAESADYIEAQLKEKYPGIDVIRVPVGPVICTHCGPGTYALCFKGKDR